MLKLKHRCLLGDEFNFENEVKTMNAFAVAVMVVYPQEKVYLCYLQLLKSFGDVARKISE